MMSPDKGDRSCGGLDTFNDIFHWSYRHRLCPALLIQLAHPCYVLVAIRSDPPPPPISPSSLLLPLPLSHSHLPSLKPVAEDDVGHFYFFCFMPLPRPPGSINIDSKRSKSWLCGCPNRMQNVGSALKRVRNLIRFFHVFVFFFLVKRKRDCAVFILVLILVCV